MDGNDQSGALTHERDTGVTFAHSPMQLPPLLCLKYDDLIYVIIGSRDLDVIHMKLVISSAKCGLGNNGYQGYRPLKLGGSNFLQ